MKAAILTVPRNIAERPLQITDVAEPQAWPGRVLLKVRACGVCRTDLHIVEGELKPVEERVIPGHQMSVSAGWVARIGAFLLPARPREPL